MSKNKKVFLIFGIALVIVLLGVVALFITAKKAEEEQALAQAAVESRLATWQASGGEAFAEQYILGGVTVSDEMKAQYTEVCNEMLGLMKYEVEYVTKNREGEYLVVVDYQRTDIYQKFLEAIDVHAEKFLKDAKKEDYKVKKEQKIAAQIQENYLTEVCQLLKTACEEVTYSDDESKTMDFIVRVDENGEYQVEESQISQFEVKILKIDEIQD